MSFQGHQKSKFFPVNFCVAAEDETCHSLCVRLGCPVTLLVDEVQMF